MTLKNGVPSVSTVSRLMSSIDEELFLYAFMEWIGEILDSRGLHLIIDGKALRGATSKVRGERTPMIMNVIDAQTKLVLCQYPIDCKENECAAIPKLLKLLNIRGSTVTIDAIGTNTGIMEQIVQAGGHYVLTVKRNNPETYEDLVRTFQELGKTYEDSQADGSCKKRYQELLAKYEQDDHYEKNRERHEHRYYQVCHDPTVLERTMRDWGSVKTVGCVRQIRIPVRRNEKGEETTPDEKTFLQNREKTIGADADDGRSAKVQMVGVVSDRELSLDEMAKIKRQHWMIENSLHHVLDDTFREDRSPAKRSRNNLALIRKISYNELRIAFKEEISPGVMTERMDIFADSPDLITKYFFSPILSLN